MTKLKCKKYRLFNGERYKFHAATKYKKFAQELAEIHRKSHPSYKSRIIWCEGDKAWYVYVK